MDRVATTTPSPHRSATAGNDTHQGIQQAEVMTFTTAGALAGVRQTLPLVPGSVVGGLVFGVLARGAGLSLAEVGLMSSFVCAGAAQFVALGLWTTPLPVVGIILATAIVNLRHLLLGAALRPWLGRLPARQAYGPVFFLSDESWALTLRDFGAGGRDGAFLLGSGLTMSTAWLGGCLLGRAAGSWLTDSTRWGLDFAFTAVFVALLVGRWRGRGDLLPWGVAALVALIAHRWLPGQWYIILGALAGSISGAVRDAR